MIMNLPHVNELMCETGMILWVSGVLDRGGKHHCWSLTSKCGRAEVKKKKKGEPLPWENGVSGLQLKRPAKWQSPSG